MLYKFAVCDDNEADRKYITAFVKEWAEATGNAVLMNTFPSAEAFLFEYAEDKSYDMLLLDIEMGKMNGIELAKKVREGNRSVQIIFITGYMEYIAEGYDVEALHFLIKPVTRDKVFSVFQRGAERIKLRENVLILSTSEGILRIPLYEIKFIEVQKNYVTIHGGQDYTVKKTLNELEKELDERFFRTGRSFVVNLGEVKKITKTDVYLKDETKVPLSRGYYEAINRAIIQYF